LPREQAKFPWSILRGDQFDAMDEHAHAGGPVVGYLFPTEALRNWARDGHKPGEAPRGPAASTGARTPVGPNDDSDEEAPPPVAPIAPGTPRLIRQVGTAFVYHDGERWVGLPESEVRRLVQQRRAVLERRQEPDPSPAPPDTEREREEARQAVQEMLRVISSEAPHAA
jgi:hypothetical protein